MRVGQVTKLAQRREVSVHREDGVGDDECGAACGAVLMEEAFERVHVEVRVDDDVRAGEATAVDQARVVECVGEDDIPWAKKGGDGADVGGVAGGEDSRVLQLDVGGQGFFGGAVGGGWSRRRGGWRLRRPRGLRPLRCARRISGSSARPR